MTAEKEEERRFRVGAPLSLEFVREGLVACHDVQDGHHIGYGHLAVVVHIAALGARACIFRDDGELFPNLHSGVAYLAALGHMQVAVAVLLNAAEDAGVNGEGLYHLGHQIAHPGAVPEGCVADALQSAWQGNLFQYGAAFEGAFWQFRRAIGQVERLERGFGVGIKSDICCKVAANIQSLDGATRK